MPFQVRNAACTSCNLYKTAKTICIPGDGDVTKAKIIVLGEAPGATEDTEGKPFVGQSGKLLRHVLAEMGILEHCYITNAVKCRPPANARPTPVQQGACHKYLAQEMSAAVNAQFVLALGSTAIGVVTGERSAPVGYNRGRRGLKFFGVPVVATYHPAAVLRNPNLMEDLIEDIQRMASPEFTKTEPVPDIIHLPIANPAESAYWERFTKDVEKSKVVSLDIETVGTDPYDPNTILLSIAIGVGHNRAYVLYGNPEESEEILTLWKCVCSVLGNPKLKVVGHNLKYDLSYIRRRIYTPLLCTLVDTMYLAHWENENMDSLGLKSLAAQYTGYGDYQKALIGNNIQNLLAVEPARVVEYNGMDAIVTLRVFEALRNVPESVYFYMDGMLRTIFSMESNGFRVDMEYTERLRETLQEQYNVHYSDFVEETGVNPLSPAQLTNYFFVQRRLPVHRTTPKGKASIDDRTIELLLEDATVPEADKDTLELLQELRKYGKLLNTYVEGLTKKIRKDGRIHPSFNITGTKTGRLSCNAPNLQNIPSGPLINNMLLSSTPGHFVAQVDYSQIELRIVAVVANDVTMLSYFNQELDLHTATASEMFNTPMAYVTPEQRRLAKTINFGILYGIGPHKLAETAKIPYHVAQARMKAWFALYPGVYKWLKKTEEEYLTHGWVENIFGRRRTIVPVDASKAALGHAVRQACNFPIQSAASDLVTLTLAYVGKTRPDIASRLLGTIHDSVLLEVPSEGSKILKHLVTIMENPNSVLDLAGFAHVQIPIPTPVGVKVGHTLA